MKKVKSLVDLKRIALSRGASLEVGSNHYNTTMERVHQKAVKAADAPAQAAPVEPPHIGGRKASTQEAFAINLDMTSVASAIDAGNERVCESIAMALKDIHIPVQVVGQVDGAKPCLWVFTVNRDTRGLIQSVEAKSK